MISEFEIFVKKLMSSNVSDDVKRLCYLTYKHFLEILPLGTAHGHRSKKIIEIAQKEFAATTPVLDSKMGAKMHQKHPLKRMVKLEIESFKGFSHKESFDLNSSTILVYGPNGTGKSSFFEAIEFSLLGTVEEAGARRFSTVTDYLKNARTQRFVPPTLHAENANAETVLVTQDCSAYRFCFVEKNRIDDFARMAAKTPAEQGRIIGTLFGLDSFNDFVKGFSTDLDSKYIDLLGKKTTELENKKTTLAIDVHTLEAASKDFEALETAENQTSIEFQSGMVFSDLVAHLGSGSNTGRIEELEQLTQNPIPSPIGLKLKSVIDADINIAARQCTIQALNAELDTKRSQISFRNLFRAILDLQASASDTCPACSTPIANVVQNPYSRAEKELHNLELLSEMEERVLTERELLASDLRELHAYCKVIIGFASKDNELKRRIEDLALPISANDVSIKWWSSIRTSKENGSSEWQVMKDITQSIEAYDLDINRMQSERETQLVELKRLRPFKEKLIRHEESRKNRVEAVEKAKAAKAQFELENAKLIKEAKAENQTIEVNKRIALAYADFIRFLNTYMSQLPATLVADLGDKVKTLYNNFNRSDANCDKLSTVRLPVTAGQKIEISFNSNVDKYYDALHILSEGHVRCLGLSILLAKNLACNCPFVIFDDPVNAIDDDHREGIRRTIFEDDFFADKQVVITCHGEEFFKDVHNLLGAVKSKEVKAFAFLPHKGDNHIVVDTQPSTRNYVVLAKERFAKGEIRDALSNSRRALENISKEIWKQFLQSGDCTISVKFRTPRLDVDLRNLAEQLRCKAKDDVCKYPKKDLVFASLDALLGIDGQSREWRYLNKGTHEEEDRAEFDRITVQQIIQALENLDVVLKN